MTNKDIIEEIVKEFREKFNPLIFDALPVEYKSWLISNGRSGVEFEIENNRRAKVMLAQNEEINLFFRTSIESALQSQRAELVERVGKMKNHNEMLEMAGRDYTRGFEKALSDLIKIIK